MQQQKRKYIVFSGPPGGPPRTYYWSVEQLAQMRPYINQLDPLTYPMGKKMAFFVASGNPLIQA